jgi:putative cell wall-binding protein
MSSGAACPTPARPRRLLSLAAAIVIALAASTTGSSPAVAAAPAAAAAQELAAQRGGSAADYRLVYERSARLPNGERLWVGKFLDRQSNLITVYRDAAGRQGGPELLRQHAAASVQALSAFDRKADPALRAAVGSAAKGGGSIESLPSVAGAPAGTIPVALWLAADEAAAEASVVARHPDLSWVGGRPVSGDLATMRRIRAELWEAHRAAYASVEQAVGERVKALGGRVAYASEAAPLVFVDLAPDRVAQLAEEKAVRTMGLEQAWESPAMSVAGPTVDADWTSGSGDQGTGIRVAVVEYHNVRNSGDLSGKVVASHSTSGKLAYTGSDQFDHPTWVAGAVAGQSSTYRGVAPGALIVSSGTGGYWPSLTYDRAVIAAADWSASPSGGNADIINTSLVQDTSTGAEEARRYFDSLVDNTGRLAVSAAGNYVNASSWVVGSPGTAYNVLTVGGTDDRNTVSRADDLVWYVPGSNGSAYIDPSTAAWNTHGDFNKPNLSAPAVSVRTANGLAASGTSVATPIVAGIGAQLLARAPVLATWPEGARAILMAGAIRHAHMSDGSVNADHEGAGLASALWSNRILTTSDGRYGGYRLGASKATEVVEQKIAVMAGQRVRVVLSWNSQSDGSSDSLVTDFDLQVRQPNGTTVGSYTIDNNYEIVEFTAASSGTAVIRLPHNRLETDTQRFGLAWTKWNLGTPSRVGGTDRYVVAAGISSRTFAPGAPAVFVATGRTFPDALSSGPAAARLHAPVLLVLPNEIPDATAAELSRLKPQRIYILGGTGSVSSKVESALRAYTAGSVVRLGGADRYEVAARISATFFPAGAPAAFVATGRTFADALSAGPAAALAGGPVLLVYPDQIPEPVATELKRLKPQRIYILGGTGSVSSGVAAQLDAFTTGPLVRIGGADRYVVSAGVARTFFSPPVPTSFIASGGVFADALAGVSAAAQNGSPLLLVRGDDIPPQIANELVRLWPPRTVVLGGSATVSDGVISQIRSLLGSP